MRTGISVVRDIFKMNEESTTERNMFSTMRIQAMNILGHAHF